MKSDPEMREIKAMTEEQRGKLLGTKFLNYFAVLGKEGFPAKEICRAGLVTLLDWDGIQCIVAFVPIRPADTVEEREPEQTLLPFIN